MVALVVLLVLLVDGVTHKVVDGCSPKRVNEASCHLDEEDNEE